jgi:integrase
VHGAGSRTRSHKERRKLAELKSKAARRTAVVLPSFWEFHQPGKSGYVLTNRDGELVHPARYTPLRKRILERAELYVPGMGWHRDRHTYAFDFICEGGRFEELQKSLGHESIVTTETLYGHFHADVAARLAVNRIYRREPIRALR